MRGRPARRGVSPRYGCYGNCKHDVGACTVVMVTVRQHEGSRTERVCALSVRVTGEVTFGLYINIPCKTSLAAFYQYFCACLVVC